MTAPFTPSPHQAALFDWVVKGRGSANVIAVAGSGKSTSLEKMLPFIKPRDTILGLAFNASVAKEWKEVRLPRLREEHPDRDFGRVQFRTFHSLGFGAVCKKLGCRPSDIKTDGGKLGTLCRAWLGEDEQGMYTSFACRLVGYAKGEGVGAIVPDTEDRWWDLVRHHDLTLDDEFAEEPRAVEIARELLRRSNEAAVRDRFIDFDDQIYLPLLWRLRLFQNDWVLVDELQDTNASRRALAKLALRPGGRFLGVGDPNQCQPAGTLISVTGRLNPVSIEDLKVGDQLITYNNGGFPGINTQGRVVEEIAFREYEGDLVKISTKSTFHEVTPNHRCHVRMTDKPGIIVYAMLNGKHARIGRTTSSHGGDFGLAGRSRQERASKSWILKFFELDQLIDAQLYEIQMAYQYGLPQVSFYTAWIDKGMSAETKRLFWERYPTNIQGLRRCLGYHNLLFDNPFWSDVDGTHVGSKYSFITTASNLFDSWMKVCVFNGTKNKPAWETASISRRYFKGLVYSLKVQPAESGRRLYIANRIVTHNSIYGFTGATHDAMDLVKAEFGCIELPLSVCYRCATTVVEHARSFVSHIEPAPGAPAGSVTDSTLKDALKVLGPHDAILCRNAAPLVSTAYELIAQGVGCTILGRDIATGLIDLIKRQRARGIDQLVTKLGAYEDREVAKFTARGEEGKAEAVSDRVACVMTVIDHLDERSRTVPALIERLGSMFSDSNGVLTLSTVHKAKGREWDNVAILRSDLMPSPWARQDWQQVQERNLQYVAATRARVNLIYLTGEDLS